MTMDKALRRLKIETRKAKVADNAAKYWSTALQLVLLTGAKAGFFSPPQLAANLTFVNPQPVARQAKMCRDTLLMVERTEHLAKQPWAIDVLDFFRELEV